jgi:hypothetical protein
MGHANVQTTLRYLHYKSKADAARRLAEAFRDEADEALPSTSEDGVAPPVDDLRRS